jgi:hypothetical protein
MQRKEKRKELTPIYRIKDILDDRRTTNTQEYLVEWTDKTLGTSWEPANNFLDWAVLQRYWMQKPKGLHRNAPADQQEGGSSDSRTFPAGGGLLNRAGRGEKCSGPDVRRSGRIKGKMALIGHQSQDS